MGEEDDRMRTLMLAVLMLIPELAAALPIDVTQVSQSITVTVDLVGDGLGTVTDTDTDSAAGVDGWNGAAAAAVMWPSGQTVSGSGAANGAQTSSVNVPTRQQDMLVASGTAGTTTAGSMLDPGFGSYVAAFVDNGVRIAFTLSEDARVQVTYSLVASYVSGTPVPGEMELASTGVLLCDAGFTACPLLVTAFENATSGNDPPDGELDIVLGPGDYVFAIATQTNGYALQPSTLQTSDAWAFDLAVTRVPEPSVALLGLGALATISALRRCG